MIAKTTDAKENPFIETSDAHKLFELKKASKKCLAHFIKAMTYENRLGGFGKDYTPYGCWAELQTAIELCEKEQSQ